ncbi:MAG: chloride channel protein [Archangium sp.]|nr:chloride channel protein [Archangium sp.]
MRRPLRTAAALLVVALGAAGFAIAFRLAAHHASASLFGPGSVLDVVRRLAWWQRLLLPVAATFAAWVALRAVMRVGASASVGEVMEAVAARGGRMSALATALKAGVTWLAILGGASIGREGPLIQFGGALGSSVSHGLSLGERQHRALVAAGTAAGFAAAYNTPIAAMLFMVEVVIGAATLEVLVPAGIAIVLATALTREVAGAGPLYGPHTFSLVSHAELLAYAILGVLAGCLGAAFMSLLERTERGVKRLPLPLLLRMVLGALCVGAITLVVPEVVGNGYEPLSELLSGRLPLLLLLALLFLKPVATSLAVSSGVPGGVFTPTLLMGACLGALFGAAVNALFPGQVAPATAYALVGVAGLCAATTHAPLMAAVLVFELSGDYAIVLPLLLVCATSAWVSEQLHPTSLYEAELQRRGLAWHEAPGERRLLTVDRAQE